MLNNFIYAKTKDLFLKELEAGNVLDEAIVFIEDTKEIWNHGTYFAGTEYIVKLTYSELKTLRDNGELIPGFKYRITDYITTTSQKDTKSANHPFDIIVQALTEDTLSEDAKACLNENDEYFSEYDAKLETWELKYCLDNDKIRFKWAMREEGALVTENCRIKPELINGNSFIELFTFEGQILIDTSEFVYDSGRGDIIYEWGYETEPNGETNLYIIKNGEGYESEGLDYNDKHYYRGTIEINGEIYDKWEKYEGDDYYISEDGAVYFLTKSIVEGLSSAEGKGVIYYMKDEFNNECPYDFKNIMFKYDDKYYYTFSFINDNDSVEDLTLRQDLTNDEGLCCGTYCNIIKPYYSESKILIQSLNNNIFILLNDYQYEYYGCYNNTFNTNCYNNIIYCSSFCSNTLGNDCYSNTFGDDCYSNTLGNDCYSNTFGDDCYSNTFGNYCSSNTFGDECYSNTFGNDCYSNTFGSYCSSNTFGDDCRSNTFGNYCSSNTFGDDCRSNTFGNYCSSNTFGDKCRSNTFGDNCNYNSYNKHLIENRHFTSFYKDINNKLIPIQYPNISTIPNVLPYTFMNDYVYEQLMPVLEDSDTQKFEQWDGISFISAIAIGTNVNLNLDVISFEQGYITFNRVIEKDKYKYIKLIYTSLGSELQVSNDYYIIHIQPSTHIINSTCNNNSILQSDITDLVNSGNVIIGNGVTSIEKKVFSNCSSLTSVEIPNSVTSIGSSAFYKCSGLTSVHIDDIAAWCNIEFGDYIANPLYYAKNLYLNGEKVTELVIPNSVTSIGSSAFYKCSGLTSVVIPNSVTSIGSNAFYDCSGLTSVVIPNSVTSIESGTFYYCSGLTSVEIPNSVTSIGSSAFYGCSSLTSVEIPNSVTNIENAAFYDCSGLTSVVIPNSVTSIGEYAFYDCSGLTSVVIPNSVTSIEKKVFYGCNNLNLLICRGDNPPTILSDSIPKNNNLIIYVPDESLENYKNTWSEYEDYLQPLSLYEE